MDPKKVAHAATIFPALAGGDAALQPSFQLSLDVTLRWATTILPALAGCDAALGHNHQEL